MKRPVAVVGFSYAAALALAVYLGAKACLWLCALFFVLLVLVLVIKPLRNTFVYPTVFLSALAATIVYIVVCNLSVMANVDELNNKTLTIDGEITDKNTGNGIYYSYEVSAPIKMNDKKIKNVNFILYTYFPLDVDYYDKIKCDVRFSKIDSGNDLYYASKDIYLSADLKSNCDISVPKSKGFMYYVKCFPDFTKNKFYRILPNKHASLLSAVITGDKSGLSKDVRDNFKKLSIYHLLVVSGLHTSIVGMFIFYFLKFITNRKLIISALITTLFLVFYAFVTGLSPSVMRAVVMTSILLWSFSLRERADVLNSLGFATLIITAFNPLIVGNYGFLLTFFNILGIALGADKMSEKIMLRLDINGIFLPLTKFIVSSASATVSASAAILPLSVLVFKYISPYIIISNLLLIPATELLVMLGFAVLILSFAGPLAFLSKPIAIVCGIIVNYMLKTVEYLSSLPAATVFTSSRFYAVWIAICLIVIGIGLLFSKTVYGKSITVFLCCILLLVCSVFNSAFYKDKIILDFIDTGNGITAVLRKNNNAAVFCCGGNKGKINNLQERLREHTDNISLLVVTKYDRYTPDIINEFNVENILLYDTDKLSDDVYRSAQFATNSIETDCNKTICLWDDITVNIVDEDNGVWIYITTQSAEFLLCPGGADCKNLPSDMRSPDYLIIQDIPKNVGALSFKHLIISADRERISDDTSKLISRYPDYLFTDNGGLTLIEEENAEVHYVESK